MNFRALVAVSLVSLVAVAATRSADSSGAKPTSSDVGVPLDRVTGCRLSIRVDGGDIAPGCRLVPYFRDTLLSTWTEADSTLVCTTTATVDGGRRDSFLCPDIIPAARFGFISAPEKVWCTGGDGGTGAASLSDGGPSSQPVLNVSCWAPGAN